MPALTRQQRPAPPTRMRRRTEFVEGVALVPLEPAVWFRLADRADGGNVADLIERLTLAPAPEEVPSAAPSESASAAESALQEIAERYFNGTEPDDEFLEWLDKALRSARERGAIR